MFELFFNFIVIISLGKAAATLLGAAARCCGVNAENVTQLGKENKPAFNFLTGKTSLLSSGFNAFNTLIIGDTTLDQCCLV